MEKCIICKELKENFQMKTNAICNICSFEKNSKKDLERTYKKFNDSIKSYSHKLA